jgi:predicted Zn-dependent peptidase
VAEKIKNIELNSLGSDYYQRLIDKLESITPAKFQLLALKHFQPDELFQVSVG